jgi:hypothetical protein
MMSGIGNRRFNVRWPYGASFFDRLGRSDDAEDDVFSDQFFPDEIPNATGVFSMEGSASVVFQSQLLVGPSGIEPVVWFRRDDILRIVLVEIDYMDQTGSGAGAAAVTRTKYLANTTYFDEENGRTYRGCVRSTPRYNRAVDRKTLRGRFTSSVGSIEIDNEDGEFDDLLTMACDGSEVRFYIGDGGDVMSAREPWLRSEFIFVFSAVAVSASAQTLGKITITLKDSSLFLEKTIGGGVPIGGTGVNANKPRPKNFGLLHNVPCPLRDAGSLMYAPNEDGNYTLLAVRCRGDSIAYADNGDGTFNLLANPAGGLVTADLQVDLGVGVPALGLSNTSGAFRVSDAFYQLVGIDAGLIAMGKYAGASTNFELNWSNDYHTGLHIPEAMDLPEVVDALCDTGNVYYAIRRDGYFTFGWFRPEALEYPGPHVGASVATIRNDDLVRQTEPRITHADPSESFYSVQGYGNINWTPQTDLGEILTEEVAEQYRRDGYYAEPDTGGSSTSAYNGPADPPGYNTWIQGNQELYHKTLRRSLKNRTLISGGTDEDAGVLLTLWQSIRRTQRMPWLEFLDVTVDLSFFQLELGNVVTVNLAEVNGDVRYALNNVKFQVCSIDIALTECVVRLGLVRRRPAIIDVYYDAVAVTIESVGTASGTSDAEASGEEALFGELVVELLFEDGAGSSTAANTSPHSIGAFTIGGVGVPSQIVASGGAVDGGGFLQCPTVFDGGIICTKAYVLAINEAKLRCGTANFKFQCYCRFRLITNRWGYIFWGFQNGTHPSLYVETGTGALRAGIAGGDVNTGYVQAADNTWRKYEISRESGVTSVSVNNIVVYSQADVYNYGAGGHTTNTVQIVAAGNGAGGFSNADMDGFRFYNGNV